MPQQASAFLDKPRVIGPWETTIPAVGPPGSAKKTRRCALDTDSSRARLTNSNTSTNSLPAITWTVSDISKAACLLSNPPVPTDFGDEQEMRRVYSLIYDVFRYRNILSQALVDVQFFAHFHKLYRKDQLVWLLLYDLYHRKFLEREQIDQAAAEKLFPDAGLTMAESALWASRVRLAAAMSRLRIANSALRLCDMLPPHLRDEKVARVAQLAPVTCWVNKNKTSSPDVIFQEIGEKLHLQVIDANSTLLSPDEFRWDPLCPMFLSFHHSQRTPLAQSHYVRNNILILLNRSFCYGPATFCKVLFKHNLTGNVVQTHISSPRATAYLATLLSENDQIFTLLAFGAGDRTNEIEDYLDKLQIRNVRVYSRKFTEMEPNADVLEQVVAVFVTPPNSYSAVNDPIDLVCSRGGDLSMLEILTDTEDSIESQNRVMKILEEQRDSLRFAMSRPQIQFVVYETHSQLSAENQDMVTQVTNEINSAARYKHAEQQGKLISNAQSASILSKISETTMEVVEINNNEAVVKIVKLDEDKKSDTTKADSASDPTSTGETEEAPVRDFYKDIQVPATDIFQQYDLPDLCNNMDQCLDLTSEGTYIALLKRKEVIRMDAKYMIKMAEARGLFGNNTPEGAAAKSKGKQSSKKKKSEVPVATSAKRKRGTFEVERISAQTHASIMRSCAHARTENGEIPISCCPRHPPIKEQPRVSPARLWWAETARYLTRLKKSLVKQKLVTNKPQIIRAVQQDKILTDINNIDEILTRTEKNKRSNIPVFPKLRLSRSPYRIEREVFPVCVNSIVLPSTHE